MKKIIGIVRNDCGTIVNLVIFDMENNKKILIQPTRNSEVLFGKYPLYNKNLNLIGNKGLVILEKINSNIKLITCAGLYIDDGIESQIIAKAERLNMRFINADVMQDNNNQKFIYVL